MKENLLASKIIGCAIEVHKTLGGPGLLESVYEEALVHELQLQGLSVVRQASVPIYYKQQKLSSPLRLDLLIEDAIIIECKSTIDHNRIFEVQCHTYLKLTNLKLGFVLNFGQAYMKNGIHRVVNNL